VDNAEVPVRLAGETRTEHEPRSSLVRARPEYYRPGCVRVSAPISCVDRIRAADGALLFVGVLVWCASSGHR